jgi:hypothetical protein
MRPSLSPFENGAYGTPFRVVSDEVGGPHTSDVGRAETKSNNEGAMVGYVECVCITLIVLNSVKMSRHKKIPKLSGASLPRDSTLNLHRDLSRSNATSSRHNSLDINYFMSRAIAV